MAIARTAVKIAGGLLALVALVCVAAALTLGVTASTPPIADADGDALPGSIAVLERIELGGLEQWILIRGASVDNPVLLWLHGGPGAAQMPFAHELDRALERRFVVVHWDQRGAGKSNHRGFDERTMRVDRYVEDARELIERLRRRFGREQIVLLGHSWGTQIGVELIAAYPQYFSAYIGVSQTVDHERATAVARDWLREQINPNTAPADWRTLNEIPIPARQHREYRALNRLVDAYGGSFDLSLLQLARIAASAPEYTWIDYLRLVRGMNRGGGPMHDGGVMAGYDHIARFPSVNVPVYFFSGANDYNTPLSLVREYHDAIDAPHKELIEFEHSAHLPFLAEHDRFVEEVARVAERHASPRGSNE